MELLHRHRRMLLNPRYGRIGMVVYPYLYLLEMFGPLVEFLGYFAVAFSVAMGLASPFWLVGFLLVALFFGVAVSIAAVALEELCFRRYPKFSDLVRLFGIAFLENFGHRQIVTFWRAYGFFTYLTGKKGWGGSLRRVGFDNGGVTPGTVGGSGR
jgi:hypothetical protein